MSGTKGTAQRSCGEISLDEYRAAQREAARVEQEPANLLISRGGHRAPAVCDATGWVEACHSASMARRSAALMSYP